MSGFLVATKDVSAAAFQVELRAFFFLEVNLFNFFVFPPSFLFNPPANREQVQLIPNRLLSQRERIGR